MEYAFRIEVRDTIDQFHDLAGASCSGLVELVDGDPTAVPRLRAYAAFLERVAANEPTLATSPMKSLLEELEDAVRELDEQLARCSIRVG